MLAVAIIPSNQIRNVSNVPGFEAYNEHEKCHWLADRIAEECLARGVTAQAFPLPAETAPGQTYDHQWIVEDVQRANVWLTQQGGGVMVHLHTDSGLASHTFGIFAGQRWPQSQYLVDALGRAVHELLATESYRCFERLGDIDYNTYVFAVKAAHTPCLLEMLSHQNERDIRTFYAHADRLAVAIADALRVYAGIGIPTPREVVLEAEIARLKATRAELETVALRLVALARVA